MSKEMQAFKSLMQSTHSQIWGHKSAHEDYDIVKQALERNTPKKLIHHEDDVGVYKECPNCETPERDYWMFQDFCPYCGQRLEQIQKENE